MGKTQKYHIRSARRVIETSWTPKWKARKAVAGCRRFKTAESLPGEGFALGNADLLA